MRWLLLALALAGCGAEPAEAPRPARSRGDARVGGDVVSTVDGHPIMLEDVRRAVERTGVPPRVALRRLQDELLLGGAAAQHGLDEDPDVRRRARQEAVQELLRVEVEETNRPEGLPLARLEAALEADPSRWVQPARRRSVTVLARVPEGATAALDEAARAWIARQRDALAEAEDPERAALALQRRAPEALPFEVSVDAVMPLAADADADAAYLEALFAPASAPAVAPAPVRSSVGWHAVVVTELLPPMHTPREEALELVRGELAAANRAQELSLLLRGLGEATAVHLRPEVVGGALADPTLLGGAP